MHRLTEYLKPQVYFSVKTLFVMPRSDVLQRSLTTHVTVSPLLSNNERPPHFPYRLRELKEVPRRLLRSPKPSASQRVGRVRSFRLTPVYSIRLEDVLSGKHLPPLTLHEFESYLVHIERSSENLCVCSTRFSEVTHRVAMFSYFILWFNDYTKRYQEWNRTSVAPNHSHSLAYSYMRAKESFFTKSATLELNLNADTLAALSSTDPLAHPPPSSFADVRHQVEGMLTESLHNFVRTKSANAGRNRGLFAIFVGLVVMCIGLAPILSSVLQSKSKWLRIAALPCFWFGATTLICGLHGVRHPFFACLMLLHAEISRFQVCIIIFLFGDARQLTAYELARPRIQHHTLHYINTHPKPHAQLEDTPSFSSRSTGDPEVSESVGIDINKTTSCGVVKITQLNVTPSKLRCDTDISPFQDRILHAPPYTPASPDVHSPATIAPFLLTPPPEQSRFDFDQLLSSESGMSRSPPVFGPLTRVLEYVAANFQCVRLTARNSRICIRTYWETVTRSAAVALFIAFLLVVTAVAA